MKYINGVNLDLWEKQRNTLYGITDQIIYTALEKVDEFTTLFKKLFNRQFGISIISQIKNGLIKFDRSEKDAAKMELIAEKVFQVEVWRLFGEEAFVPLNDDGQEMFICDICGKSDTTRNLKKTKDGKGRHKKCEATYRRNYRHLKKELGMTTEVLKKMKKRRDALLPHGAIMLEGLLHIKANVLKVKEYVEACEKPEGLFLPSENTFYITPAGMDYLMECISKDIEKITKGE